MSRNLFNGEITEEILQKRMQQAQKMKVAMMTIGEMGHIMPTVHLAAALEAAGHTVTIISNKYGEERVRQIVTDEFQLKAECHFPDNCTREQMTTGWNGEEKDKLLPLACDPKIVNPMKQKLAQINPDIVVVDYATGFGGMAADALNLPTVCLCSAPLKIMEQLWEVHSPTEERLCTCCSIVCILPTWADSAMSSYYQDTLGGGDYAKFYKSQIKRTILCNSFYGLDRAIHMPPNVYLTGPHLTKENEELVVRLQYLDSELADWLNEALQKNEKVIFISLGSMINWQQWYVKELYDGIEKLSEEIRLRAIFVMPKGEHKLPSGDKPTNKYWPTKSCPTAEVLAHPAVLCGLSHCDFASSLEYINAGKPLLTFPHFGSQGVSSSNLIQ